MSRIWSCRGALILALLAAGCGGSGPETPPEQKAPQAGLDAMEKLKGMQLQPGVGKAGGKSGPESASEKMKNMGAPPKKK